MEKYTAGFDGSSKPNPGEMTIGGWIKDSSGKTVVEFQRNIGNGTNNMAEYSALIELLQQANELGIEHISISGDSALVVNQVNGSWKTKNKNMKYMRDRVQELLKGKVWSLRHVYREYNEEADALTR